MKLLVLGGSGAMGAHLCELVVQRGADVTVTTRRTLPVTPGIKYLIGNAQDEGFLRNVLAAKWDCIVDFMVYSTAAFRDRLPLILASTKQYIFISSARVFADSDKEITECSDRLLDVCRDADYLSTDDYALAKARQEDLLTESGRVNWTIVRPYITYAEERMQLGVLEKEAWLYRLLHGRSAVLAHDIAQKETTMTYGRDVANVMAKLIGDARALGEVYNITGSEARTWLGIWKIYQDALTEVSGIKANIELIDTELFEHIHGSRHQIVYDRLYNRVFDSRKVEAITGSLSYTDPEVGLQACVRGFMSTRCFKAIDARAEGLKDRLTGSTAKLGEFETAREKLRYIVYRFGVIN